MGIYKIKKIKSLVFIIATPPYTIEEIIRSNRLKNGYNIPIKFTLAKSRIEISRL
jgi:hypothetical protein